MDVKIAVITGAAFAGVLVAGALAAPRGSGDDEGSGTTGGPTSIINTDAAGNFVFEPAATWRDDDDDVWEDDDHDDDDDDDDDDDRRERDHDDDDDHDDHDDHEDDD